VREEEEGSIIRITWGVEMREDEREREKERVRKRERPAYEDL
jgi:hypothetical protein